MKTATTTEGASENDKSRAAGRAAPLTQRGPPAGNPIGQLFRAAAQTLLRRGPAPKKSRRRQTGEDHSELVRYLRRLFRKTGRHVGDDWQDDPTDGTDWYSQHRQRERIAANSNHSTRAGPARIGLPRLRDSLLKRRYG